MEPRQQWRGNIPTRQHRRPVSARFNGAAPTMARKPGTLPRKLLARVCFNGAAPTMARKHVAQHHGLVLGLASMEPRQQWRGNVQTPGSRNRKSWLQWSRANNGAETVRLAGSREIGGSLQWSRANNGAETMTCWLMLASSDAASMEPRQQWRGNVVITADGFTQSAASMEPRQQWRGNV